MLGVSVGTMSLVREYLILRLFVFLKQRSQMKGILEEFVGQHSSQYGHFS